MSCGTATYIGIYAIIGAVFTLYALHTKEENKALYFNIGMFPIGVAAIAEADILTSCAANILSVGAAALLIVGFALIGFSDTAPS